MAEQQLSSGDWGIDNDYGVLRDVLLGKPEYYRREEAGPLMRRRLQNMHKTGVEFDFQLAQRQHREMVKIYAQAGINCHFLNPDPVLHRNFFARDSNAMTPWGAPICHMQPKSRRADYHSVSVFTRITGTRSGSSLQPDTSRAVIS